MSISPEAPKDGCVVRCGAALAMYFIVSELASYVAIPALMIGIPTLLGVTQETMLIGSSAACLVTETSGVVGAVVGFTHGPEIVRRARTKITEVKHAVSESFRRIKNRH